jgi:phenylalanyl-tRNA synthetase beta chain
VRFAEPGETVVTLDDIERQLDTGDVLIVDDVATAAIGGVMGAAPPRSRDRPPTCLLEAAVWDRRRYRAPSGGCTCPARRPRAMNAAVDPAVFVAALDRCAACSPKSPVAQSNPL